MEKIFPAAAVSSRTGPDRRTRMKVKIGELAKMTGCQVVTIRYYEKEGLLKRPERTERNYRLYGDEDIARLRFIRHCRRHGMSLDEIRTLLVYSDHPTGSCDWINRLIRTHIEAVEQQIRDLEHLRAHLESLYHKCDGSREGGCGILKTSSTARTASTVRHGSSARGRSIPELRRAVFGPLCIRTGRKKRGGSAG